MMKTSTCRLHTITSFRSAEFCNLHGGTQPTHGWVRSASSRPAQSSSPTSCSFLSLSARLPFRDIRYHCKMRLTKIIFKRMVVSRSKPTSFQRPLNFLFACVDLPKMDDSKTTYFRLFQKCQTNRFFMRGETAMRNPPVVVSRRGGGARVSGVV